MVGERAKRIRKLRNDSSKFSKGEAYYVNDSYLKSFRCANCNHYNPDTGKCDLVSSNDDPNPGAIAPKGSCALFNARPPRIMAMQMLWGRDDIDGVAPEVARATAFMFTYAYLDETPPKDLKEKALITPEQIKSRRIYKMKDKIMQRSSRKGGMKRVKHEYMNKYSGARRTLGRSNEYTND